MSGFNTISPNMSLVIPTVGQEPGPQYATDVNASLTIIDTHNHSPGSGVQITPLGLNINTSLSFQQNPATNVSYLQLYPLTSLSTALCLYSAPGSESPTAINDLWWNDGNGNKVQITSNGAVYAPAAQIPGESYTLGTFSWRQGAGSTVPANFDIGNIILRPNVAATTYGTTLQVNPSIASSFTLTLPNNPSSLSGTSFLELDHLGNITTGPTVNAGLTTSNLSASANILGSQLSASANILGSQLSSSAGIVASQISAQGLGLNGLIVEYLTPGTYTFAVPATDRIIVTACGGGGGGGGVASGFGTNGTAGGNGTASSVAGIVLTGFGYGGGLGLTPSTGGAGGATPNNAQYFAGGAGGVGGVSATAGTAGTPTMTSVGGSGGSAATSGVKGGGGGGGGASTLPFYSCSGGIGGNGTGVSAGTGGAGGNGNGFGSGGGGGGGSGGDGGSNGPIHGGGGGSASSHTVTVMQVTPNSNITVVVGAGGSAGTGGSQSGASTGANGGAGAPGYVRIDY